MSIDVPTPECDRMLAAVDENDTQTVGDFLDWLQGSGYQICESKERGDSVVFHPVHKRVEEWLAARHGIDLVKVEAERRAMFQAIHRQHEVEDLQKIAADTSRSVL